MKLSVTNNISCREILDARGLGQDKRAIKTLASIVMRRSDKRVPFQDGYLKNQVRVKEEGGDIILHYIAPYAHYHYQGEVMAGRAPKHYTGRQLHHNGAPLRGSKWDVRTMESEGNEVRADFAAAIGGKPV